MKSTSCRLARLLEAAAVHVVKPAVVNAADAAILEAAVAQVGAPVRAMDAEQAGLTLVVPKEDQVFAEQSHGQGRASDRQLLGQRCRLPVPTQ